ncbi:MAG: T9SS type A sorting domain-containing protein [candidate division KSB1 bacterium]|nr:T9SS type A sorting domain-containing protein [candidate division KSB1 bacterium]
MMRNWIPLRRMVSLLLLLAAPATSQWSPPVSILSEAMPSAPDLGEGPIAPVISSTVTADALHLVWSQAVEGNIEIFHALRQANKWSEPVNISKATGISALPVLVASSDGFVHCAWTEIYEDSAEIYYANLAPTHEWGLPLKLTQPNGVPFHAFPVLAVNSTNEVHCLWSNIIEGDPSDKRSLSYRKKLASGQWSGFLATPQVEVHAFRPALSFDADNVLHCVWYDGSTTNPTNPQRRIDYSFLSNGVWSPPVTVAKGAISDDLPLAFAAAPDKSLHVFGYNYLASSGFSIRKTASGWQAPVLFNREMFNAQFVTVQNQVHVIYETPNGIEYTFFQENRWQPAVLLQSMPARFPTMTSDGKSLHAFWLAKISPDTNTYALMQSAMPLNLSSVNEQESNALPLVFQLLPAYPNPFSHTTEIGVKLESPAEIQMKIFDAQGRFVRTLAQGQANKGWFMIQWDGTNDAGQRVANGVYYFRLQVLSKEGAKTSASRPVLYLKIR